MVRTRFAPSPTGFMHVGNLRTALYEYLLAKTKHGTFILRIEDTDQERLVDGSIDKIYETLRLTGLQHDEGPDIGGDFGPYVQSERKSNYMEYAKKLVEKGHAYYCFCTKETLESSQKNNENEITKYDRRCTTLSKEEIENNLANNLPFIIRQLIPEGTTTFHDEVYGEITVENSTLDDQVLIKSDGLPTYNFANVVDDHLMEITHVLRGSEYLSSTPKYNLLYEAFAWEVPIYLHLPLILNSSGEKLSKRKGDASFEDLVSMGYLPKAIINYIALLGWSPSDNREFFTLDELIESFDVKGLSKSPSIFDVQKLKWMNSEYFKKMDTQEFYQLAVPYLENSIKRKHINLLKLSEMLKSRVEFVKDVVELVDFIDELPSYESDLYIHKKMKTTVEIAKSSLESILPVFSEVTEWTNEVLHEKVMLQIEQLGIKNGMML